MYRINPDSKPVLMAVAIGTALVFLASFALSAVALYDVALWAHVPFVLAGAVPVMLDVALVVYSLSALVRRARGQSARFSWALLGFFTAVSLVGNAAHAVGVPESARPIVGAVVVALAPVAALAALENLAGLVIASPAVVAEEARAEAEVVEKVRAVVRAAPADADIVRQCLDLEREGLRHKEIGERVGVSRQKVTRLLSLAREDTEPEPALFAA